LNLRLSILLIGVTIIRNLNCKLSVQFVKEQIKLIPVF